MKHHILQSLIALPLLLGISQNAFAYNLSANKTVYFDNAVTQWSAVYVIIGHDGYSRAYKMEAEPNTTLYRCTMSPAWENYNKFVIASSVDKSSLDGGGVNITEAYSTCTSRINGISDNVADKILITVTSDPNKEGNTSIYSYTSTNTFDINKYNVPVVAKKATHLIIFNSNPPTLSAHLWSNTLSNHRYNAKILEEANGTTLSYFDNSTYDYHKSAPHSKEGEGGGWEPADCNTFIGNVETERPDTFPDNVLYYRATTIPTRINIESFKTFTHLSATFEVSSASPCTNEQITLTATPNKNATLYKDGGNRAKYAFYVKDAANNVTCISDFSENASVTDTTPATAQTITLYCYVRDLYGLETIQYTKTITINYCNTYYYYNKNNWETVKAYIWDGTIISAYWPGSDMQAVAGHDRWYSITIRSPSKSEWIIFNNGYDKDISDDIPIHSDPSNIYYSSFEQHPSYDPDKGYSWYDGFISEINYDNNDGSGTTTKAYCQEGKTITLPTPAARTEYTFSDENASITKVSQAYGLVSLSRSHFADPNVPANAKKFYWISFPFDVHLSEVFSSLTYGSQYLIKYYDGVERAAKGYWIDSPTFWKMYTKRDGVVLKKGVGYLLHVNCNDTAKYFDKGNQTINIYFPSANTDSLTINSEIESITVPEHKCTIQRAPYTFPCRKIWQICMFE